MNIKRLGIPGCYQITPKIFSDERGLFIKTFHSETLHEYGIDLDLKEEFYSKQIVVMILLQMEV